MPCIVLSVLLHVKHIKAVYSVKTKTKAKLEVETLAKLLASVQPYM